jgi:hypothetical protein
MIVRIMTEGQYEVAPAAIEDVRHEDEALLEAVEAQDADQYRQHLQHLLSVVRQGRRLPPESLAASDLVLPPPDLSVTEAHRLMTQHQIY